MDTITPETATGSTTHTLSRLHAWALSLGCILYPNWTAYIAYLDTMHSIDGCPHFTQPRPLWEMPG